MKKIILIIAIFCLSLNCVKLREPQTTTYEGFEQLKNEDWHVRSKFIEELGKTKNIKVIPLLLETLNDKHAFVRCKVIEALGEIGDKSVTQNLIKFYKREKDDLRSRREILISLGKIKDEKAVSFLMKEAKNKNNNKEIRIKSIDALGEIGDKKPVKTLITLLKSEDTDLKISVIYSLGKLKDSQAVEPLISQLGSNDTDVLCEAVYALGEIKDTKAVKPLIPLLKHKEEDVRNEVVTSLNKIKETVPEELILSSNSDVLLKIDDPPSKGVIPLLKDKNSSIRELAAKTLGRAKWKPSTEDEEISYYIAKKDWDMCVKIGERALVPLIEALKDNDISVRKGAVTSLGKIGDERAIEPIIEKTEDPDREIRKISVEALGNIKSPVSKPLVSLLSNSIPRDEIDSLTKIGEPAIVPVLKLFKTSNSPIALSKSADVLGGIPDKRSVKPLVEKLEYNDERVRKASAEALSRLGWIPANDSEKVSYYIAKQEWDKCVEIGTPAVERLIYLWREFNWGYIEREVVINTLVNIGKPAVKPLITALQNKEANKIQENAIITLGRIGDKRAIKPLTKFTGQKEAVRALKKIKAGGDKEYIKIIIPKLKDKNREIRVDAVETLGGMGKLAVEPLINALKNEDWLIRSNAAASLGIIKDSTAVEPLILTLGDKEAHVKRITAYSLGRIGDCRSVKLIINLLEDDIPDVRNTAIQALSSFRCGKILISELQNTKSHKVASTILEEVIWIEPEEKAFCYIGKEKWDSCVKIGGPAVKPLVSALRDEDWKIRKGVAESLEKLNYKLEKEEEKNFYHIAKHEWDKCVNFGKPAEKPLIDLLLDKDALIRKAAAETLDKLKWSASNEEEKVIYLIAKQEWDKCANLGAPVAKRLILLLYKDSNSNIQNAAVNTLVKIGEPSIDSCIWALKYSYRSDVWFKLTDVLSRIGKPALKPLFITLKDGYSYARVGAACALGKMGDTAAVEPLENVLKGDEEIDVKQEVKKALDNIQNKNAGLVRD
ncbi:MAG: HEAT repeat domain-containing protein [bacterium]